MRRCRHSRVPNGCALQNAGKVDWSNIREALPVFIMAIFVPFTYSIFNGVIFGFSVYIILLVCTGTGSVSRRLRNLRRRMLPAAFSKKMRHIGSWASWIDTSLYQQPSRNSDSDPDVVGQENVDGGNGLYLKLNTSDTVTVPLFDPTSQPRDIPTASTPSTGQWKTIDAHNNPISANSSDDELDDGEDYVDENKMLSFTLSAIGDAISDDAVSVNPGVRSGLIQLSDNNRPSWHAPGTDSPMTYAQDHRWDNVIDLETGSSLGRGSVNSKGERRNPVEYSSFSQMRPTVPSSTAGTRTRSAESTRNDRGSLNDNADNEIEVVL
jgi:hypothetical protein